MPEIDKELAAHCLSDLGSVNSPNCPIIRERTLVMQDNLCDGLSIRDRFFAFLVQAVQERDELEPMMEREPKPKRADLISYTRATSQVAVLSYTVALMDNPYLVNAEEVLASAEKEASK